MEIEGPKKGWLDLSPEELIEAVNNLGPGNLESADREIMMALALSFPNESAELWRWVTGTSQKGRERQ